jgi:transcriptional regulator with XRE-family HTH domain
VKDGERLKLILENHRYTAKDVAAKLNLSDQGVYYYYGQEKIKRKKVAEILGKMKIPVTEFYPEGAADQVNTTGEELQTTYGVSRHQGRNLENILNTKHISVAKFALECNVARTTLYRYFNESELDEGFLLLAAEKAGVPVAQIKGVGMGQRAFEKDIYNLLSKLSNQINTLQGDVTRIAKAVGV